MFDRAALSPRLFLALHDSFTGKQEVGRELLARAIGTAALVALLIDRRIDVVDGRIVLYPAAGPGAPTGPPADDVDTYVVDAIAAQGRGHSARVWIESLGDPVLELVSTGLITAGVVRRERRVLSRGPDRFPAVDIVVAGSPRVRLEHMVANPREFTLEVALVAAILAALGAERTLPGDTDPALFTELIAHLPRVVRMVIDGLGASVAALTLTVRR